MKSRIQPFEPEKWRLPRRAIHKLYRGVYREPIRKIISSKVLKLSPSPYVNKSLIFSVHTLICKRDLYMGIWSAKSLNLFTQLPLPWVFHDDGSLDDSNVELLQNHFPGAEIIRRNEADAIADEKLRDYPLCKKWRETSIVSLKVFDFFFFNRTKRLASVDTDILFFKKPIEMLNELFNTNGNNIFNRDIATSYGVSKNELESIIEKKTIEKVNAGLYVQSKSVLNLNLIESWLRTQPFQREFKTWTLEQGIVTGLATVDGLISVFPESYDVDLKKNIYNSTCKHYVGKIRHGFELEGIRYLLKDLQFERKWNEFAKSNACE